MAATEPRITVRPNGPYAVVGDVTVVAKAQIETELGEPIVWRSVPRSATRSGYAGRCGAVGTQAVLRRHASPVEFEAEDAVRRPRTPTEYPGTGVTLYDDRDVCVHAGFCGTTITNVWKMVRKTDDTTVRSMLVAMVERCPSGAISLLDRRRGRQRATAAE